MHSHVVNDNIRVLKIGPFHVPNDVVTIEISNVKISVPFSVTEMTTDHSIDGKTTLRLTNTIRSTRSTLSCL